MFSAVHLQCVAMPERGVLPDGRKLGRVDELQPRFHFVAAGAADHNETLDVRAAASSRMLPKGV